MRGLPLEFRLGHKRRWEWDLRRSRPGVLHRLDLQLGGVLRRKLVSREWRVVRDKPGNLRQRHLFGWDLRSLRTALLYGPDLHSRNGDMRRGQLRELRRRGGAVLRRPDLHVRRCGMPERRLHGLREPRGKLLRGTLVYGRKLSLQQRHLRCLRIARGSLLRREYVRCEWMLRRRTPDVHRCG